MKYIMSDNVLKEKRKFINLISVTMPLGVTLSMFLVFKILGQQPEYKLMLIIGGIMSVFMVAIVSLVGKKALRKISVNSLVIDDDGVEVLSGNKVERINYIDIVEITALYNYKKTELIQLTCKGKDKTLLIHGFENMEVVRETFENQQIKIEEKKLKADWANPLIFIGTVLGGLLIFFSIMGVNYKLSLYLMNFITIGFGVLCIKGRIISKNAGSKSRKSEVFIGSSVTILGLISIIAITLDI